MRSIGSQRNAIEMHEKRKGDQAMWMNSVFGTRVHWLEPERRVMNVSSPGYKRRSIWRMDGSVSVRRLRTTGSRGDDRV